MYGINMHIKVYSISYAVMELQITIIVRYQYIPIGMTKIQNTDTTKCWWDWGAAGLPICFCGNLNSTATLEDI